MTRQAVFAEVAEVVKTTFKTSNLEIHEHTTAADVDGWDSVAHATLIVRLEKRFNVRIPDDVISQAATVGELVDGIFAVIAG